MLLGYSQDEMRLVEKQYGWQECEEIRILVYPWQTHEIVQPLCSFSNKQTNKHITTTEFSNSNSEYICKELKSGTQTDTHILMLLGKLFTIAKG